MAWTTLPPMPWGSAEFVRCIRGKGWSRMVPSQTASAVPMVINPEEAPDHAVRGPLSLLTASMPCWKCRATTTVGALAGGPTTEAWLEDAIPPRWVAFEEDMALGRVVSFTSSLEPAVQQHLPTWRPAFSQSAEMGYWMNHCHACGAGIGDFFTQSEPDGPFFAWPRAERAGISIVAIGEGEVDCETPYIIPPEHRSRVHRRKPRKETP